MGPALMSVQRNRAATAFSLEETYAMQPLTGCTMAVFGSHWFLATELILNFTTVAATFPFHFEALVTIVNFVWLPMLPLVFFTVCAVPSL